MKDWRRDFLFWFWSTVYIRWLMWNPHMIYHKTVIIVSHQMKCGTMQHVKIRLLCISSWLWMIGVYHHSSFQCRTLIIWLCLTNIYRWSVQHCFGWGKQLLQVHSRTREQDLANRYYYWWNIVFHSSYNCDGSWWSGLMSNITLHSTQKSWNVIGFYTH